MSCDNTTKAEVEAKIMSRATFWQQLLALLKRNLLYKIRYRRTTCEELIYPLIFVLFLAFAKLAYVKLPQNNLPAKIQTYHSHTLEEFEGDVSNISLYVSPDTYDVQSVVNESLYFLSSSLHISVSYFGSAEEAQSAYLNSGHARNIRGINFALLTQNESLYTIRIASEDTVSTEEVFHVSACGREEDRDCVAFRYLASDFVWLQIALDTALIRRFSGQPNFAMPDLSFKLFPKAHQSTARSLPPGFDFAFPFTFVIAYSCFVQYVTALLVMEKENGTKKVMNIMGMRRSAYWISWFLIYSGFVALVTVAIVALSVGMNLLSSCNVFLLFLMLFLFGLSLISLAFMVTPIFSKAIRGSSLITLITWALSLVCLAVMRTRTGENEEGPVSEVPAVCQYLLSLISPVAIVLGVDQALYLELHRGGLNFNTVTMGQFPVCGALVMLFIDCVLYRCLGFYFEYIFKKKLKHDRPICFCIKRSFWKKKLAGNDIVHVECVNLEEAECMGDSEANFDYVQARCEELAPEIKAKRVIRINNLSKVYRQGQAALEGLTLDVCEGQITALIGHNGAGKSTLMAVLTGLIAPTSGDVKIHGLDVKKFEDREKIRSMLGFCPQQNVLFGELTVREHLELFARSKGVHPSQIKAEVDKMLKRLAFEAESDMFAIKLSGGQMRKLCVAVALINSPKVILLDEPTAGMDPVSRRIVWSYLQSLKSDHVILFSTQFMDEADTLADRKAVISRGKLMCAGSSLFLKTHFGVGYQLCVDLEQAVSAEAENVITLLIQKHIPAAVLRCQKGHELTYMLPVATPEKFPDLFRELEDLQSQREIVPNDGDGFSVTSFGVSINSLEELLMKIELEGDMQTSAPLNTSANEVYLQDVEMQSLDSSGRQVTGDLLLDAEDGDVAAMRPSWRRQVAALVTVRILSEWRMKGQAILRIIIPVVLTIYGILISNAARKYSAGSTDVRSLSLNAGLYSYTDGDRGSYRNPKTLLMARPTDVTSEFVRAFEATGVSADIASPNANLLEIAPHYVGIELGQLSHEKQVASVTLLYNDTAVHSLPVAVHLITSTVLKMSAPLATIQTSSQPWPKQSSEINDSEYEKQVLTLALIIGMALSQIAPTFADGILKERQMKCRRQLRVTGVSSAAYWFSRLVSDGVQFYITAVLFVMLLLAFQVKVAMFTGAVLALVLLYVLWIPQIMLYTYLFSLAFDKPRTAQFVMPNVYILISLVPYVLLLKLTDSWGEYGSMTSTAYVVETCCLICFPPCVIFIGLHEIMMVYVKVSKAWSRSGQPTIADYFAWTNGVTLLLICILVSIVILLVLLRKLEGLRRDSIACCKCPSKQRDASVDGEEPQLLSEDQSCLLKEADVEAESQRVERLDADFTAPNEGVPLILVRNLRKKYSRIFQGKKKVTAVICGTSFAVDEGEIFGLLGPNGAGKSTTLGVIIGETTATTGRVKVNGQPVKPGMSGLFSHMSYCPQEEPLWPLITFEEHLECYAALRGVAAINRKAFVNRLLSNLKLHEHRKTIAKKLSGGTKRKKVALLDEPSSGMDPSSRRLVWNMISKSFHGKRRCCILTTHHMEEADALCSRVSIMVNGQLQCIGSTQRLKSRYGSEYLLELKVSAVEQSSSGTHDDGSQSAIEHLDQTIKDTFARVDGVARTEHVGDHVVYRIPQDCMRKLSDIFSDLETLKRKSVIQEYSFSQSTLEQVFLKMARQQRSET